MIPRHNRQRGLGAIWAEGIPYEFRIRSRVFRWYGQLREIEERMQAKPAATQELVQELDALEEKVAIQAPFGDGSRTNVRCSGQRTYAPDPIAAMSASAKRTPQSRPEADIKRLREPSHRHKARRHCLQGPLRALPDRAFGMSAQHARGRRVRLEKVDDARGLKFA